jgi:hypothetical protein
MENHEEIDQLLLTSILEYSKLSGVIGDWVILIHDKVQIDPLRLVCIKCIHLVHLLQFKNKRNGGGDFLAAEDLENLLVAIVQIDLAQQN